MTTQQDYLISLSSYDLHSELEAELRDRLTARGYAVTYVEFIGDTDAWEFEVHFGNAVYAEFPDELEPEFAVLDSDWNMATRIVYLEWRQ